MADNNKDIEIPEAEICKSLNSILLSPAVASPALAINEKVKMLRSEGKEILMCGFGESPFPPPASLQEEMKLHVDDGAYEPTQGIPPLRKAICQWLEQRHCVHVPEAGVIVTPGAKMAIYMLVSALDAEVLLPVPCWVSYRPMCQVLRKKYSLIQTTFKDEWKLTPKLLDEHCNGKTGPLVMILNTPHNPTGAVYTEEEIKALIPIMEKYNITLISDEIYASFELKNDVAHVSPAALYDNTILISGLSKVYGVGGWRIGFAALPDSMLKIMPALTALASISYSLASVPVQKAALRFFLHPEEVFAYRQLCRSILGKVGSMCHSIMSKAGIDVHPPDGAYYLFVDFSPFRDVLKKKGVTTGPEMCSTLMDEAECAMLPGTAFEQTPDALTARFCFVDFDGKHALHIAEKEVERLHSDSPPSKSNGPDRLVKRAERLFSSGPIGNNTNTSSVFWEPSDEWCREFTAGPIIAAEKLAKWVSEL